MKKFNKWIYESVVQGDYGYGHGWEDLISGTPAECRGWLHDYECAGVGRHRVIRRRTLNPLRELLTIPLD